MGERDICRMAICGWMDGGDCDWPAEEQRFILHTTRRTVPHFVSANQMVAVRKYITRGAQEGGFLFPFSHCFSSD